MDLRQLATGSKNNTHEAGRGRPDGTLHGRHLVLARSAWIAFALVELVLFIAGIFAYATQLHTVCTNTVRMTCNFWQPTPGNIQALMPLGIQLPAYATAFLTIDVLVSLIFWGVGLLIFWRKSETWIGLFVSLLLVMFGAAGISDTLNTAFEALYATPAIVLLLVLLTFIQYGSLALFLLTFPDGRFVPRWSWVVIVLWFMQDVFFQLPPPYNVSFWPLPLFAAELLLTWGTTLAIQVFRYVRVYDRGERQQVKWLLFGLAIVLILNTLYRGVENLVPGWSRPDSLYQLADGTVAGLLFVTIPLCIGIAILRYRLWDIDLIINRTLVYGTLSASVIGMYVLVVVYLGALLRTGNNPAISLVATGIVAVLFQPLRTLLQRVVNRLVYGKRDDPYAVLARLGSRLEATLVPEKVLPTIVETVAQTLRLPYVAIALLALQEATGTAARPVGVLAEAPAEEPDIVASYGSPTSDLLRMPLIYQGETIGYLLLAARTGDTFGKADERLLTDLARQAGVAVYAVRLTTHLQHLTQSLQQARERLVTTREEERRRLRRDLHDGLGPTLASLTFKVDAARNLLTHDTKKADRLLDAVRQQAQEAVIDIRRLVYNLRPPALDELGLVSALREQVALYQHQGLEVEFDTPSTLPSLPAAVEVAAYRIAQEALTNVARHAQAQRCLLQLSSNAETLHLDITDDGKGLPVGHRIGVGLHTMHERASELGGSCTVIRGSSGGTTIQARLPLGAAKHALPVSDQYAVQQEQENILAPDVSLVRQEE
ncbi:MAG: hypothetical protein NVSMB27_12390 [Ktedonobacteraceae bacterium]